MRTKNNLCNRIGHFWIINFISTFIIDHYFLQAYFFDLCRPHNHFTWMRNWPLRGRMKLTPRDNISPTPRNQIGFASSPYSKLSFTQYIRPWGSVMYDIVQNLNSPFSTETAMGVLQSLQRRGNGQRYICFSEPRQGECMNLFTSTYERRTKHWGITWQNERLNADSRYWIDLL